MYKIYHCFLRLNKIKYQSRQQVAFVFLSIAVFQVIKFLFSVNIKFIFPVYNNIKQEMAKPYILKYVHKGEKVC